MTKQFCPHHKGACPHINEARLEALHGPTVVIRKADELKHVSTANFSKVGVAHSVTAETLTVDVDACSKMTWPRRQTEERPN